MSLIHHDVIRLILFMIAHFQFKICAYNFGNSVTVEIKTKNETVNYTAR